MFLFLRFIIIFMSIMSAHNAIAGSLQSVVMHQDSAEKISIFLKYQGNLKYKFFELDKPVRAVIDLEQTDTTIDIHKLDLKNDIIKNVRLGYHEKNNTLRLVFDLKYDPGFNVLPWKHGLRVELVSAVHPASSLPSLPRPRPQPKTQEPKPSQITRTIEKDPQRSPKRRSHKVIVVIDPGHGGKDPGAIGQGRSVEKKVVLAIALKLKKLIDQQPGMHAILTRSGDYFIGLRERMSIAQRYHANVFIAIHADAFNDKHARGASVYALSPRGATSEAARWLAEKENHSELGGANLAGLDDENGVLRTVLLDLSQTATTEASLAIGGRVLQCLDSVTTLHNHKVEQARFMVLKSPDIPSILIETGFLSNPHEEIHLSSRAYQEQISKAIYQGTKHYFQDYPSYE